MLIRKANQEESETIASLMMLAMEDIVYNFIGEKSAGKALCFLSSLTEEKGNQYSYENCWIAESGGEIVGTAIVYDGARLNELREPVGNKVKNMFNREFNPEDETQAGEYYIDCVGVSPNQQGKGIGTKIFQFLIEEYVEKRNETLGLLVDQDNPNAKKLYLKLGFEIAGEKTLAGKKMEHLQFKKKESL
ncbi:GNAT family N-acetyltransferase [Fluviicola sp.]|uniref:GNAT family N-acetyltransferase n=1 Tax=Fluviicola sp. TaxID=1917219 RepID=UPI0026389600|nr:GNAT family N-acetyltransferase [Fluviicola sp.]